MKKETLIVTTSTQPDIHRGAVSVPVYRASTILFPTLAEFEDAENGRCDYAVYGRYGTPTSEALEQAIAKLEGADHSIVTSSGVSAIASSLLAFLSAGDHLLMVDTTYGPTRRLCDYELKRLGIETTYYDPYAGPAIASLIKPNTKVIFVESPGSLTFEVQDIRAICKQAHEKGVVVISDSTWGTPVFFNPLSLGVDVSVHSATKYISGHSDVVIGVISCNEIHYKKILHTFRNLGACPSGDDCYLSLRGLRTISVRLNQQFQNALKVAQWLKTRPEVSEVLYPALAGAPGHELWKRDFTGAASLFSIILKENHSLEDLGKMLDGLEYFGMGYSWGGFESLIIPCYPARIRTAKKWSCAGNVLRLHIGLENPDDLIADLEAGFSRLA